MEIVIKTCNGIPLHLDFDCSDGKLANLLSIVDKRQIFGLAFKNDESVKDFPDFLESFENLSEISFERCHLMKSVPRSLAGCRNLKKLSVLYCADFDGLSTFRDMDQVEFLSLCGCGGIERISDELLSMKNLAALDLSHCEALEWIEMSALPASLRILDVHDDDGLDFDNDSAAGLQLVSLKIQDYGRDWQHIPVIEHPVRKLRKVLVKRSCTGMDD